MLIPDPDYPHVVLSFMYRGWHLEIDQGNRQGAVVYAVWATGEKGCAVAVPCAKSRLEAIERAKTWVDRRLSASSIPHC